MTLIQPCEMARRLSCSINANTSGLAIVCRYTVRVENPHPGKVLNVWPWCNRLPTTPTPFEPSSSGSRGRGSIGVVLPVGHGPDFLQTISRDSRYFRGRHRRPGGRIGGVCHPVPQSKGRHDNESNGQPMVSRLLGSREHARFSVDSRIARQHVRERIAGGHPLDDDQVSQDT